MKLTDTQKQIEDILKEMGEFYTGRTFTFKDGRDRGGIEPATTKLVALMEQQIVEGRLHENQMGYDLHIAIRNGLEQQSENAQLTATWKANEQMLEEFKLRIDQLKKVLGKNDE